MLMKRRIESWSISIFSTADRFVNNRPIQNPENDEPSPPEPSSWYKCKRQNMFGIFVRGSRAPCSTLYSPSEDRGISSISESTGSSKSSIMLVVPKGRSSGRTTGSLWPSALSPFRGKTSWELSKIKCQSLSRTTFTNVCIGNSKLTYRSWGGRYWTIRRSSRCTT